MSARALPAAAAAAGLICLAAGPALAGGEVQSTTRQTVTQTQTAPQVTMPASPVQPYRYCIPYPYNGPGRTPCAPPNGMTHYAPGGWVYPGYAYAGYGASGYGPGPFLTGGIVGLTLGAIIF